MGNLMGCVLVLLTVVPAMGQPPSASRPSGLHDAREPKELTARIGEMLSDHPPREPGQLIASPDISIALAGGWARVLWSMPAKTGDIWQPDRLALARFIGLVEGRVGMPVPADWEKTLYSAVYSEDRPFFLPTTRPAENEQQPGVAVSQQGDSWVVQRGTEEWRLPVADRRGPVDDAAVVVHEDHAYVTLHAWPATQYMLYRLDRASGRVEWSTRVWGVGEGVWYQGYGFHWVQLRLTSDQLVVFGISNDVAYVEIFGPATGHNLCRFGTSYFTSVKARVANHAQEQLTRPRPSGVQTPRRRVRRTSALPKVSTETPRKESSCPCSCAG